MNPWLFINLEIRSTTLLRYVTFSFHWTVTNFSSAPLSSHARKWRNAEKLLMYTVPTKWSCLTKRKAYIQKSIAGYKPAPRESKIDVDHTPIRFQSFSFFFLFKCDRNFQTHLGVILIFTYGCFFFQRRFKFMLATSPSNFYFNFFFFMWWEFFRHIWDFFFLPKDEPS